MRLQGIRWFWKHTWGGTLMIKIRDLHAYYGPIEALKGIDMVIEKGKITCLIGSNGAGKVR